MAIVMVVRWAIVVDSALGDGRRDSEEEEGTAKFWCMGPHPLHEARPTGGLAHTGGAGKKFRTVVGHVREGKRDATARLWLEP